MSRLDAGWNGRTNLSRKAKKIGAKEDRKKKKKCSADHEQDWQP